MGLKYGVDLSKDVDKLAMARRKKDYPPLRISTFSANE